MFGFCKVVLAFFHTL